MSQVFRLVSLWLLGYITTDWPILKKRQNERRKYNGEKRKEEEREE